MKVLLAPTSRESQAFIHERDGVGLIQIAINLILNFQIQTLVVLVHGTHLLLACQFPLLEAPPTELN